MGSFFHCFFSKINQLLASIRVTFRSRFLLLSVLYGLLFQVAEIIGHDYAINAFLSNTFHEGTEQLCFSAKEAHVFTAFWLHEKNIVHCLLLIKNEMISSARFHFRLVFEVHEIRIPYT